MPSKNTLKTYVKDGIYHVYNRGVAKQEIYREEKDYKVFLSYLRHALSPLEDPDKYKVDVNFKGLSFKGIPKIPKSYYQELDLIAYCLMPNHFHLLVKQLTNNSMPALLGSLCTRYSMYFNAKFDRVGPLFQGRYKAVMVSNEEQLLHLSRYIHLNPRQIGLDEKKWYSSYPNYTGIISQSWVKPKIILDIFDNKNNDGSHKYQKYEDFVEDLDKIETSEELLRNMSLDSDL